LKEPVKILVCPLNWGIGHASRMIPVIHQLLHARAEVILAACGKSAELLKTEFPDQTFIDLPSFPVRYSRKRSQIFILALQIPLILVSIIKEHMRLKKITAVYSPDVIISDNRYGLFHKKIISVFVTHQVSPALPAGLTWMEPFVFHFLGFFIKRFDRCWIPDVRDPSMNLTGRLSHRYTPFRNMAYMGILSRFSNLQVTAGKKAPEKYDILIILSGPEPQRSLLGEIMMRQLKGTDYKTAVICGLHQPPSQQKINPLKSPITFYYHLPATTFKDILLNAGIIICRSGYSTVMDLAELDRPAILIPTPGQSEQEYLARHLSFMGFFYTTEQKNFNLQASIRQFRATKFRSLHHFRTQGKTYVQDLMRLYEHKKENDQ